MKTLASSPLALLILIPSFIITSLASAILTPEAMISAPRRGSALPNPAGTLALYTPSEYSFITHKTTRGLYVLNITDGSSWLFSNKSGITNAVWLGDGDKFVWLAAQDDGSTNFLTGDAKKPGERLVEKLETVDFARFLKLRANEANIAALLWLAQYQVQSMV